MKDGKKVKYNLYMGIAGQIVAVVLGILLPKLILENYGSEVNGLLSSVTNIYAYIAIVEAGIAAAACQALYKPMAEEDHDRANEIMAASHRYYRRVGVIYLALVCLFATLYPLFIKTEISFGSVVLIILFNGLGNVINFFFHGKYLILLRADGKQYVRAGLDMFSVLFKQVAKIVLIHLGFDVVVVQFAAMLTNVIQMLWIARYIRRKYPWIDLNAKPDNTALVQSKYVLAHEVNYLITSNLDAVLLTIFTNLKVVSIYALYTTFYDMVTRVLRTIRDALEFKIAYEFHRNMESFRKLFEAYEVFYITLAFSLFSIVSYFILSFMRLYTADVTDINYIDAALPLLFTFVHLLAAGRYPSDAMIHIAGHFKETKNSAMTETLINLGVSIALVQFWGIKGVLLGTIVSSLYRTNYLIWYVNRNIVMRSVKKTYLCWLVNLAVFVAVAWLNQYIVVSLDSYVKIFAFCVPYSLCTLAVFFGVMMLCMPRTFWYAVGFMMRALRKKRAE